MEEIGTAKERKKLTKGNKIVKIIDNLKDKIEEFHPASVGVGILEIAKVIDKKMEMASKHVDIANKNLNSTEMIDLSKRKMRVGKYQKLALKNLLEGGGDSKVQGLDEEVSNSSKNPMFQKEHSEGSRQGLAQFDQGFGDSNSGFGQGFSSGMQNALQDAGFDTDFGMSALNFSTFEDIRKQRDMTINGTVGGGFDVSGYLGGQGLTQIDQNLTTFFISKKKKSSKRTRFKDIDNHYHLIKKIDFDVYKLKKIPSKAEAKLNILRMQFQKKLNRAKNKDNEDQGYGNNQNFDNFGFDGGDFNNTGFDIGGDGPNGLMEGAMGGFSFPEEFEEELKQDIEEAEEFEKEKVSERISSKLEKVLSLKRGRPKYFQQLVKKMPEETDKSLLFYHLCMKATKDNIKLKQNFGESGGSGELPLILIGQ